MGKCVVNTKHGTTPRDTTIRQLQEILDYTHDLDMVVRICKRAAYYLQHSIPETDKMSDALADLIAKDADLIAETTDQTTQVWLHEELYFIFRNGTLTHAKCADAETVIRALCHYLIAHDHTRKLPLG